MGALHVHSPELTVHIDHRTYRVQLAKMGHGPCSSQVGDNFYVVSSSLILV